MADLFISYASADRELVAALVHEFEDQGWSVWWDRHIEVGTSFDDRIEEAIDQARCIVVVWSEKSIRSDWVRAEAAEGLKRNILVPVLLDDVKPPLLFRQKQALSLIDWKRRGDSALPLVDLLPSISSILEGYDRSSLPVSTQRAWALGQAISQPDAEDLARASFVALNLALTYFENLFVYSSVFRGKSTQNMDHEQLADLVKEEGLDGYIYGEIARNDDEIVFNLHIHKRDQAPRTESTKIIDRSHLPSLVAECVLHCAGTLQGMHPREGDHMVAFLQARNTDSLNHFGQSFQYAEQNRYADVRDACEKSLGFDDTFHWPYEALATAYQYLGRLDESRKAIAKAARLTGNESQRNALRIRGMYYALYSEDYEKSAKEFETLVAISPLDESAINNLAVAFFYQLKFDRARELSARDRALYPMKKIGLQNAAFYSLYAGAFHEAEELATVVLNEDSNYVNSLIIKALVLALDGEESAADGLYLSAIGENDRRDAVLLQGRADLALAQENWMVAHELLAKGISLDQKLENHEYCARKHLMRAEAALGLGQPESDAIQFVNDAIRLSKTSATLANAALLCIRFNLAPPPEIESNLKRKVNAHGRAYSKLIAGYNAYRSDDLGTAMKCLDESVAILDLWVARLARAYLFIRAELRLEAADEIAQCLARPGEAISATLDEQPTYRYLTLTRGLI